MIICFKMPVYLKILSIFAIILSVAISASAQLPGISGFQLLDEKGGALLSNAIIDIRSDSTMDGLYLATGKGVARFIASIDTVEYTFIDSLWSSYTTEDGIGKGGVSGLDVKNGMVWIATSFDSSTSLGQFPTGGGIAWTVDPDSGWSWMPQPVDTAGAPGMAEPLTTPIGNVTYDISITDSCVWIASFYGGLRKFEFADSAWHNTPPDTTDFDFNKLSHRAFAVITPPGYIFVGTGVGISRSDDGENWDRFDFDNSGISGNFITALAHQHTESRDIIWAATWPTNNDQFHSVSKSENWGATWTVCHGLDGEFTHNFAFDDSIVYAATDNGMWKSSDYGDTWYLMPLIEGENNLSILEPEVLAGRKYNELFFIGTLDGLASTYDYGNTWWVYRAVQSTAAAGEPDTYAYPNPFSPSRAEAVRLQYYLTQSSTVTVKIYDFALELVRTLETVSHPAGDWYETWDGRSYRGEIVANGVYFYKLMKQGQGTTWGKIIVLD